VLTGGHVQAPPLSLRSLPRATEGWREKSQEPNPARSLSSDLPQNPTLQYDRDRETIYFQPSQQVGARPIDSGKFNRLSGKFNSEKRLQDEINLKTSTKKAITPGITLQSDATKGIKENLDLSMYLIQCVLDVLASFRPCWQETTRPRRRRGVAPSSFVEAPKF